MIQGKWFAPGTDLSSVLAVRESVFGRGQDDLDTQSWNVLVIQDSVPVATGRIWWQDGAFRLGDLCVLESYRRRKLGDLVLRLLLFKAQSHAAREGPACQRVRIGRGGDVVVVIISLHP